MSVRRFVILLAASLMVVGGVEAGNWHRHAHCPPACPQPLTAAVSVPYATAPMFVPVQASAEQLASPLVSAAAIASDASSAQIESRLSNLEALINRLLDQLAGNDGTLPLRGSNVVVPFALQTGRSSQFSSSGGSSPLLAGSDNGAPVIVISGEGNVVSVYGAPPMAFAPISAFSVTPAQATSNASSGAIFAPSSGSPADQVRDAALRAAGFVPSVDVEALRNDNQQMRAELDELRKAMEELRSRNAALPPVPVS